MPYRDLTINELLMLLAVDDVEGTIHWQASPYLNYALAGGLVAELVARGQVRRGAGDVLESVGPNPDAGSALLAEAHEFIAVSANGQPVASVVANLAAHMDNLPHRQLEELVERGVLERHEQTLLLLFHRTRYPAHDSTPEKRLIAAIRDALLGPPTPVEPRLAVLITLAQGAHLLAGPLSEEELDRAQERLASIAAGQSVGEAACHLIRDAEQALYVASSIPFMGVPHL